jgi:NADH-quinone oxidoreductase subunit J
VLVLFGIMLTRAPMRGADLDNDQRWPAAVVGLFLAGILSTILLDGYRDAKVEPEDVVRSAAVGESIFRDYVVPFEVVSMLLLAALIGAVVIARRD